MKYLLSVLLTLLLLCGCSHSAMRDPTAADPTTYPETGESPTDSFHGAESTRSTGDETGTAPVSPEPTAEEQTEESTPNDIDIEEQTMQVRINDTPVSVQWEDNESVTALMGLVQEAPLTITMSPYGGFEQVGPLGTTLPRDDAQTTTQAGDLVLYSGNQIVVFYGSNTWAYTRLGRITDKTRSEMAELLGNGPVTVTIIMEGAK